MASEVAHPESLASNPSAPLANGDVDPNADAFEENASLPKTDTSVNVNVPADLNAGGPTPVEDTAPGITPIADYVPNKDLPTSHPTPPPDEPLATSEAIVDTEMTTVEDVPQPQPDSKPAAPIASSNESSLVRSRDDDGEDYDEPAAKRTKLDETQDTDITDAPPVDAPAESSKPLKESASVEESLAVTASDLRMDAQTSHPPAVAPEFSEPVPGKAEEPAKVKDDTVETPEGAQDSAPLKSEPIVSQEQEVALAPAPSVPSVPAEAQAAASEASVSAPTQASAVAGASASASKPQYSTKPLTQPQHRYLLEKMKNLKKTRASSSFLNPVDPVALNIPTYLEIVKNPMDLNTMERKLKNSQYGSVQDFAHDFDLIISNSRAFNGDQHPVTQFGFSMEAYFRKMMESVPSSENPALQKPPPKKASPKPAALPPRREVRNPAVAAPPPPPPAPAVSHATTTAGGEAFALQADGTPQIRRDSTINRPARTIKPPPARELPYAKPKRKEHQLELKFCEHILTELKGPKHANVNHVFQQPVDPVALNIPHYRQVVKHPMDLSTMTQKLKNGEYGKAAEFKKDFELMVSNCLAFNPAGNPVREIGVQFGRDFETLWKTKDKWEKAHKSDGRRGASASADEESAEEEEEEEENEVEDEAAKAAAIAALQKQLTNIQNALTVLNSAPPKKKKKAKALAKTATKKAAAAPAPKQKSAPKAKAPKKVKTVSYEEKQEISEAVGNMNEEQVNKLTAIITENVKKYADQEEMELEIDDLPNDVQAMLLKYVRSIFGNPNRGAAARADSPDDMAAMDDDDFEPQRGGGRRAGGSGGGGNKRKKHKPMGKEEQQAAISNIQKRLNEFQNAGVSASQSPVADAETSGDDESEESEEE